MRELESLTMSEEQVTEPTQTAGQMLRKAREAKGMSVNDMAKALRLTAVQIENLEADQFLEFKTPTFVRGYLRAYAKQVNIDEATIFQIFEQQDNRKPDVGEMRSFSHKEARKRGDKGTLLIGVCVVLVVAFGVIGWIYQNSSTPLSEQYPQVKQPTSSAVSTPAVDTVESSSDSAAITSEFESTMNSVATEDVIVESEIASEQSPTDGENTALAPTEAAPVSNTDIADNQQTISSNEMSQTVNDVMSDSQAQSVTSPDQSEGNAPIGLSADNNDSANTTPLSTQTPTDINQFNDTSTEVDVVAGNTVAVNTVTEDVFTETTELTTSQSLEQAPSATTDIDEMPITSGVISQVELHFAGECWAKLVDATGETLVLGVKNKDHISKVQGVAPFQVLLGNPDAVEIYLDGEQVTKPDTPRGAIAKFNLPIAE